MPCKDALLTGALVAKKGQTVEEVVAMLEKENIRAVPVVDEKNILIGLFSYKSLFTRLLPVSATMEDGLQSLDFIVGAVPGIAKRLRKLYPQNVEDIANKDCKVLYPETPSWEAVRLIVKYGSPIPVVDDKTGEFMGIITKQSLMSDFKCIIAELEAEGAFDNKD